MTHNKYDRLEPDEDRPDSTSNDVRRDIVQVAIANEMAEMNRLKRLELQIKITELIDVSQLAHFDIKQLEDKVL